MKKRVHIIYSGMVQGVGFRYSVERIANSLDIYGWVRNAPDGMVELIAEGDEEGLVELIDKVKKAMGAYIRSSKVEWEKPQNEFDSFQIRHF